MALCMRVYPRLPRTAHLGDCSQRVDGSDCRSSETARVHARPSRHRLTDVGTSSQRAAERPGCGTALGHHGAGGPSGRLRTSGQHRAPLFPGQRSPLTRRRTGAGGVCSAVQRWKLQRDITPCLDVPVTGWLTAVIDAVPADRIEYHTAVIELPIAYPTGPEGVTQRVPG